VGKTASFFGKVGLDIQKVIAALGGGSTAAKRGVSEVRAMLLAMVLGVAILIVAACNALAPAVSFAECVANAVVANDESPSPLGLSDFIDQRAVPQCGGDALAVLEAVLTSSKPQVKVSPLYAQAARVRTGFLRVLADAGTR